jgi:peptidoglycan/LPS O-acetylase OafA/YrhL
MQGKSFRAFDGLRASAALLVLAYHVCLATGLTRGGALAPVAAGLKGGVTIFFVISGFLLYVPYARAIRGRGPLPGWRRYARRRILRIVPAYWVALTLLSLGPLAGDVLTHNWWRYYLLTQAYSAGTVLSGLGVAWSLCVEVSFYAVLPLLARGLARLVALRRRRDPARTQLSAIALIALASLALRVALAHGLMGPHAGLVLSTVLPGMADWFAIGIGLAVVAVEWEHDADRVRAIAALARRPGGCWGLAACCYGAAVADQHGDLFLPLYGPGAHLAFGLAAGLVVLPAIRPDARMGFLSAPVPTSLGTVSYGIYLWHVPLLQAIAGKGVPAHPAGVAHVLGLLAVVALGATALGAASWYLVERPAQRPGQAGRALASSTGAPSARPAYEPR